jgi:hypothetical protein
MTLFLQGSLIILGLGAIGCAIVIGAFTDSLCSFAIKTLAGMSTICLTFITSYNLVAKASNVRDGWRHLSNFMYLYQIKAITLAELIKAYDEGEKILGNIEFHYGKP